MTLEDRTLLSSDLNTGAASTLPDTAISLSLDSPWQGTIAPRGADLFQVNASTPGLLRVSVESADFTARLSLVDDQGHALVQSDAVSAASGANPGINVHVPQGVSFLEVQSLAGGGSFALKADLTPAAPPLQEISTPLPAEFAPLAVADFNNDGIPDLAVPDGIHLGLGDGTFGSAPSSIPISDVATIPTSIVTGDLTGSGLADVVVAEAGPGFVGADVRVYLNAGGGQLVPAQVLPVDAVPDSILLADLGNGHLDLAVASLSAGTVAIFWGDGTGHFSTGPVLSVGMSPLAMVAGQFVPGQTTLVVALQGDPSNAADPPALVFINADSQGQLATTGTFPLSAVPSALVAGKFGNGSLDLAVASASPGNVSILLGDGTGQFTNGATYSINANPAAMIADDLNNDGKTDLVIASTGTGEVTVLLGDGVGTFEPPIASDAGLSSTNVAAADLNRDGRVDLVVGDSGSGGIAVLLSRGDGTFRGTAVNRVGATPAATATADLNHDGRLDVVTANTDSDDISVLLGNGDGTFGADTRYAAGPSPIAVTLGDFNGDGRVDIAVADSGDATSGAGVSVLLGNGDGTFQAAHFYTYDGAQTPSSIVAGDFTGDGVLDLAVADSNANAVVLLVGDGRGGFVSEPKPFAFDASAFFPVAMTVGDFGNGHLDLAVVNEFSNNVSILLGDGAGSFQVLPPISVTGNPSSDNPYANDFSNLPVAIVAGDFSGHGTIDLAVVSSNSDVGDNVTILLNDGLSDGGFAPQIPIQLGFFTVPTSIVAGDFDGTGKLSLAIAELSPNQIAVLTGNGDGTFTLQTPIAGALPRSFDSLATGDFDGDGRTDLAIGELTDGLVIRLNEGNGQFVDPANLPLSTHSTPILADLNGDGIPDLTIVDGAGDILFRQGLPNQPGIYAPPITVNTGDPSRDIAVLSDPRAHLPGVFNLPPGLLLASVDARDNKISLFAYVGGRFTLVGHLSTGAIPAQIVAADLSGAGGDADLVVRDAGDGTLTVYLRSPSGAFLSPITIPVGSGIANLSAVDLNGDGRLDLLLTNRDSGQVEAIINEGFGLFSAPTVYQAGSGLAAVSNDESSPEPTVSGDDGTTMVVAGSLSAGRSSDLVTLNVGSGTLGLLTGLGGGRFANATSVPIATNVSMIGLADLTGDGVDDLVTIAGGDVTVIDPSDGGFGASDATSPISTGLEITGFTVADANGDGKLDLILGDAAGNVLVLAGDGRGGLAIENPVNPTAAIAIVSQSSPNDAVLAFTDPATNRVLVRNVASGELTVVGDQTSGLLAPSAAVVRDLNGDGLPDLIVANSGGDNVVVYPGLPGGKFGNPLNGATGFVTGTNPVAITVGDLNGDGRPDLIVANKGSNNVAILLNEAQGNSFTFVDGPHLQTGNGPVSTALVNAAGNNGIPDLVVSDAGSSDVRVLKGLGNGFFNDAQPTIIPLSAPPGAIVPGHFTNGSGSDISVLNPTTDHGTLIAGLGTPGQSITTFLTGGNNPVSAIAVASGSGFDDLIVANSTSGGVDLLLGGSLGLTIGQKSADNRDANASSLALASVDGGTVQVFGAVDGEATAIPLTFLLGAGTSSPGGAPAGGGGISMLPLSSTASLPLIATLLLTPAEVSTTTGQAENAEAAANLGAALAASTSASGFGQSLSSAPRDESSEGDGEEVAAENEEEAVEEEPDNAAGEAADPKAARVNRGALGLDEALDRFRQKVEGQLAPNAGGESRPPITPDHKNEPRGETTDPAGPFERAIDAALDGLLKGTGESAEGTVVADPRAKRGDGRDRSRGEVLVKVAAAGLVGGVFLTAPTRRGDSFRGPTRRAAGAGRPRSGKPWGDR